MSVSDVAAMVLWGACLALAAFLIGWSMNLWAWLGWMGWWL